MMDPYEYQEAVAVLLEQLPRALQLSLKIDIDCGEPRIAIFTANGRSYRFPIKEDGRIADHAVSLLCVVG